VGTADRYADIAVIDEIQKKGQRNTFFQAVYRLQKHFPNQPHVGGKGPFSSEMACFRAHASLAFPVSDIAAIERTQNEIDAQFPPLMFTVNFLGLYGPSSPLPAPFTEQVIGVNDEDNTIRHFLDLFHHRYVSFVYRAWEKYRYYVHYQGDAQDHFSEFLFAFAGLRGLRTSSQSSIEWKRLLPLMSHFSQRVRSRESLEKIIQSYLGGLHTRIEEFVVQNVTIDKALRTQLGLNNTILNDSAFLGRKVRDVASRFTIHIGPISYSHYCNLLPGEKDYVAVRELVRLALVDHLDFDFQLKIDVRHVPKIQLGHAGQSLGRTTWLGKPQQHYHHVRQSAV